MSSDEDAPLVAPKPAKSDEREAAEAKDVTADKAKAEIDKPESEPEAIMEKAEKVTDTRKIDTEATDETAEDKEKMKSEESPSRTDSAKDKRGKRFNANEDEKEKVETKPARKGRPRKAECDDSEQNDDAVKAEDDEKVIKKPKEKSKARPRKSKDEDSEEDDEAVKADDDEKDVKKPKEKGNKEKKKKVDKGSDEENAENHPQDDVPANAGQRKSMEHFHPEMTKTEIVVGQGEGEKLCEIPGVRDRILEHVVSKKDKYDALKMLSRMLFNRIPSPKEIKENLLQFSGKCFKDEKEEDGFRQIRVGKRSVAELKAMLEVLGLERSGKQQELAGRLFSFLKKPGKECLKAKASPSAKRKSSVGTIDSPAPKKRKISKRKSKDDEDEEEDEDEEVEEEEEEAEEVKKETKKSNEAKAKKSPAKKATPTRKGRSDKEEDAKQEDDEAQDDDEELRKIINDICAASDLSTLTLRMVRELLEKGHSVDIVAKRDLIRKYVDLYVASK